jgi:hypothetical protein
MSTILVDSENLILLVGSDIVGIFRESHAKELWKSPLSFHTFRRISDISKPL